MANVGFASEKEYTKFVLANIDEWVLNIFGETVKNTHQEWYLAKVRRFGANQPRIDLMIELNNGKRIGIEIKNPKQLFHESSRAISQLLSYSIIAEENEVPIDEMVLVVPEFHPVLGKMIAKYNLPIRVVLITKTNYGEYVQVG